MKDPVTEKEEAERRAQEPDNLPLGKLLLAAAGTIFLYAGAVAISGGALTGRRLTTVPPPHTTVQHSLISNTAPGLERGARLDDWGWADRDAGIAKIPIGRAIELTLKERR